MKFSERFGFKPINKIIQIDSMSDELRVSLWNIVHEFYLTQNQQHKSEMQYLSIHPDDITTLIWVNLWKKEIDKKEEFGLLKFKRAYKEIFFSLEWYEVYDLVEFIVKIDNTNRGIVFKKVLNSILERELSAYRIVDDSLVKNIEEYEIESIENAIHTDKYSGVKIHIKKALDHISDKTNPDFRNSIKESIISVETIFAIICGKENATLGEALKIIDKNKKIELHPSLIEGYKKIYGYTSNGDGIRHALLEEDSLEYEDALYMLVSCSAFVNYLISKFEK